MTYLLETVCFGESRFIWDKVNINSESEELDYTALRAGGSDTEVFISYLLFVEC